MARICRKCFQVGITVAFGAFLIANAVPDNVEQSPYIEPQLTAGASKMPIVDWQTTEVKVSDPVPETIIVAEPTGQIEELTPEPDLSSVGEPTEVAEPQEEPQEHASYLLYRVVQAEGYTMGYEGMRYITSAILNLARDRGCSVDEVLASGAYTVVNTGAIWRQELLPETIAAVDDDLSSQIDTEIKYFRTGRYHGFGTPRFNWGNVYFSK